MENQGNSSIQQNRGVIHIQLASPDVIRGWSFGEVTKPETVNYRSFKPERDGLFCEKIFGPVKSWECNCGKYKRQRHRGIVCDRCGVEVTDKKVRRERMGHIELMVPVVHIWFYRGVPNIIGLLGKAAFGSHCFTVGVAGERANLESVVYHDYYLVLDAGNTDLKVGSLISPDSRQELIAEGRQFTAETGGTAVKRLLASIDFSKTLERLRFEIKRQNSINAKAELLKQLRVVEAFNRSNNRPEWMVLDVLPVLPPDLRPLVHLDGGRFATSDLNEFYRKVITRNNRLKRMVGVPSVPELILRNEKRLLQGAVDKLFDNARTRSGSTGGRDATKKSLSELLKGKQGRFRQNLLGKRVDYSGRSVIVVGPELRMHECGLPKDMARELYKPFIIQKLTEDGYAHTVKSAKKFVEKQRDEVWDILEGILDDHPVLLNRAPTLHRLGIQAFYPRLVDGKAIRLHPLVCAAFNADFDGDQMAVHLPLSFEAQLEARVIMIAPNNILHPASGKPIAVPSQDIVLGLYYISKIRTNRKPDGKVWALTEVEEYHHNLKRFYNIDEALRAYESHSDDAWLDYQNTVEPRFRTWKIDENEPRAYTQGRVALNKSILVRFSKGERIYESIFFRDTKVRLKSGVEKIAKAGTTEKMVELLEDAFIETSVGRCVLNDVVPQDVLGFANIEFNKKNISRTIDDLYRLAGNARTVRYLDDLKDLGFNWSGRSGISAGICDMIIPPEKEKMVTQTQERVDKIYDLYENGVITDGERYNQVIDAWSHTTNDIANLLFDQLKGDRDGFNPVFMMADSGARGSREQIKQLSGMRGLMQKPVKSLGGQEVVENPIRSSFREGLNVMEYFISTHGARKGLADIALKTADAGYLTRRLVDVAQDVVITIEDCGTKEGKVMRAIKEGDDVVEDFGERILGRVVAEDVHHPLTNELLIAGGEMIDEKITIAIEGSGLEELLVRSVLTCDARTGVCAKCYGRNLANGRAADIGEAVGVIAAQSIGEPGTQLTLRTFHIGGASSRLTVDSSRKSLIPGRLTYEGVDTVERPDGVAVVISRSGEAIVSDETGIARGRFPVPYGAALLKQHGDGVKKNEILYTWDPYNTVIISQAPGAVEFDGLIEGRTYRDDHDDQTGLKSTRIIVDRRGQFRPYLNVLDAEGNRVARFQLPAEGVLQVEDGAKIEVGDVLLKLPRSVSKTRDITGGLPRVADLFEARTPKDPAVISPVAGTIYEGRLERGQQRLFVLSDEDIKMWSDLSAEEKENFGLMPDDLRVSRDDRVWLINKKAKDAPVVVEENGEDGEVEVVKPRVRGHAQPRKDIDIVFGTSSTALIPKGKHLAVHAGDRVKSGDKLCDGAVSPADILRVSGEDAVQEFIVAEIQKVYRLQGVTIADKHIECIVRQMMRKVLVLRPGDTDLLEQDQVSKARLREENERVEAEGKQSAVVSPLLQGITRSSLGTDSFISAAAFQETTKVLTRAAMEGRVDDLVGLKENVTMGRLIPSGTGAPMIRSLKVKDLDAEASYQAQDLALVTIEDDEVTPIDM